MNVSSPGHGDIFGNRSKRHFMVWRWSKMVRVQSF